MFDTNFDEGASKNVNVSTSVQNTPFHTHSYKSEHINIFFKDKYCNENNENDKN